MAIDGFFENENKPIIDYTSPTFLGELMQVEVGFYNPQVGLKIFYSPILYELGLANDVLLLLLQFEKKKFYTHPPTYPGGD